MGMNRCCPVGPVVSLAACSPGPSSQETADEAQRRQKGGRSRHVLLSFPPSLEAIVATAAGTDEGSEFTSVSGGRSGFCSAMSSACPGGGVRERERGGGAHQIRDVQQRVHCDRNPSLRDGLVHRVLDLLGLVSHRHEGLPDLHAGAVCVRESGGRGERGTAHLPKST
jgi:hypothetical protein